MKRAILITALISLFIAPTFSQLNNYFNVDTTSKSLSFKSNRSNFGLENSNGYKNLLNSSINNKNLFSSKFLEASQINKQDKTQRFDITPSYDNMPCIVPKGNHSMIILKPDTTARYSLLIKKP